MAMNHQRAVILVNFIIVGVNRTGLQWFYCIRVHAFHPLFWLGVPCHFLTCSVCLGGFALLHVLYFFQPISSKHSNLTIRIFRKTPTKRRFLPTNCTVFYINTGKTQPLKLNSKPHFAEDEIRSILFFFRGYSFFVYFSLERCSWENASQSPFKRLQTIHRSTTSLFLFLFRYFNHDIPFQSIFSVAGLWFFLKSLEHLLSRKASAMCIFTFSPRGFF